MVGKTVSHYEILEKLGGGGMGVVYRARDTRLERQVALKFLSPQLTEDKTARERFLREAQTASALDHPNICVVHEIGETDDGEMYLCMAYYEGRTLKERISEGPLLAEEAVAIACQIAAGLARAHEAGIVHRDIKPANIILTEYGEAKILDFGLAKLQGGAQLTRTGTAPGTVAYMSPEQARGHELDQRTDLWALGVIFYEMLTGLYPFPGSYPEAVRRALMETDPAPPSRALPEVPERFDPVVLKLLAKDPDDRYISARDLLKDLDPERFFDSRAVTAAVYLTAGSSSVVELPRERRRWPWLAALVGLAALAIGWIAWQATRPQPFEQIAVLPLTNFTAEASLDHHCEAVSASLITQLGEVPGFKTTARSEAWSRRQQNLSGAELGRAVGADAVLEGGLQREGGLLRISVNLLDSDSGLVLWSTEVRGSEEEIPAMRDEIAVGLKEILSIPGAASERVRLARDPTATFRAYDLYLRGTKRLADTDLRAIDDAIDLLQGAVAADPGFALGHIALSDALWERWENFGDSVVLEESTSAARAALALDGGLLAGHVALARSYRGAGRDEDSIQALEELVEAHPRSDLAYRELGVSYEQAGDMEAAEQALRTAARLGAGNWQNWNHLGTYFWRLGNSDEAAVAFRRGVAVSPPGITKPREDLSALLISQGRPDEAIEAFENLTDTEMSATLASNMGTAYYFSTRDDKWQKAGDYYRLAVALDPHDDEIRRNLADLYLQVDRPDEARRNYQEALRLVTARLEDNPDSSELQLRQAFYAARADDCRTARAKADMLSQDLPQTARNAHRLAYAYALCGATSEALTQLGKAIDMGVPASLILQEDEFRTLHGLPEFEQLTETQASP